jgi:hypothetical protein
MVLIEEQGMCRCVGYEDKDNIFLTMIEADDRLDSIVVKAKFGPETDTSDDDDEKQDNIDEQGTEESA